MEEELQWIEQILAGDKNAYTPIINKYKNRLFATILRMTRNPEDAQDLVQEVFIKVYRELGKYSRSGSFSSWFYRVAIHHCYDQFRKKQYKSRNIEFSEKDGELAIPPEVILLKKEKERHLERLLSQLPKDERMILLLRYVNELSYEEISELVEVPVSTVRNKLHRSKKKMRDAAIQEGSYFYEVSNR